MDAWSDPAAGMITEVRRTVRSFARRIQSLPSFDLGQ